MTPAQRPLGELEHLRLRRSQPSDKLVRPHGRRHHHLLLRPGRQPDHGQRGRCHDRILCLQRRERDHQHRVPLRRQRQPPADGTYTYTYDADNQLVEVKQGETTIASMTTTTTVDVPRSPPRLVPPTSTTPAANWWPSRMGPAVSRLPYAYDPQGGLISMTRGENTYYYQTDAHGGRRLPHRLDGAVVDSYAYDPWGKVLSSAEDRSQTPSATRAILRLRNQPLLPWHRYYDPELKRPPDAGPAERRRGGDESLNRYSTFGTTLCATRTRLGFLAGVAWCTASRPRWQERQRRSGGCSRTLRL